jgi:hypothetical protein
VVEVLKIVRLWRNGHSEEWSEQVNIVKDEDLDPVEAFLSEERAVKANPSDNDDSITRIGLNELALMMRRIVNAGYGSIAHRTTVEFKHGDSLMMLTRWDHDSIPGWFTSSWANDHSPSKRGMRALGQVSLRPFEIIHRPPYHTYYGTIHTPNHWLVSWNEAFLREFDDKTSLMKFIEDAVNHADCDAGYSSDWKDADWRNQAENARASDGQSSVRRLKKNPLKMMWTIHRVRKLYRDLVKHNETTQQTMQNLDLLTTIADSNADGYSPIRIDVSKLNDSQEFITSEHLNGKPMTAIPETIGDEVTGRITRLRGRVSSSLVIDDETRSIIDRELTALSAQHALLRFNDAPSHDHSAFMRMEEVASALDELESTLSLLEENGTVDINEVKDTISNLSSVAVDMAG